MKWLFGQVWVYCLIAFLLGVLLTWLTMRFLRRPHVEVSDSRGAADAADAAGSGGRSHSGSGADEREPVAAAPAASAVAAAPLAAAVSTVNAEPVESVAAVEPSADVELVAAPHGPGSAAPLADGAAPSGDYTVKGNEDSMRADDAADTDAADASADSADAGSAEADAAAAAAEVDSASDAEAAAAVEPAERAEPDGPYGPGSALPRDGGAAPGDDYTVKGNADSMLFHTLASPYYGRTIAEVWFRTEGDARQAGFTAWNERSKAKAPSTEWEAGPYPGSAPPRKDGSSPADEFTVKGNADSMLFHTTASPYYTRTKAEVWFRTAEDAEQAGFTAWNRPRQRT